MSPFKECFLFKNLPVVPHKERSLWLLHSPYLGINYKVYNRGDFTQELYKKITEKHSDFFNSLASDNYLELYLTSNPDISRMERSINSFLDESNKNRIKKVILVMHCYDPLCSFEDLKKSVSVIINKREREINLSLVLSTHKPLPQNVITYLKNNNINVNFNINSVHETEAFNESIIESNALGLDVTLSLALKKEEINFLEQLTHSAGRVGIKSIVIEPENRDDFLNSRELFLLNLLKAVKVSWNYNTRIYNSSIYKTDIPLHNSRSEVEEKKCCNCFAKTLCISDCELECYITKNSLPSIIRSI